ncbi:MAG: glycosyltransferase family 4 protein [Lentisphaerota bacterium]
MMRILFLTWNFPPVLGGIEYVAGHLHAGLKRRGHDVVVVTSHAGTEPATPGVVRARRKGLGAYLLFALFEGFRQCRQFKPDVILCSTLVTGPAAYLLSRLFRRPYVVLVHGSDILRQGALYQWVVRWVLSHADQLTANSRLTANLLEQSGMCPEKISVIHPGVQVEPFLKKTRGEAAGWFPPWQGRKVLLFVGRLIRRKGVLEFIERVMPDLARDFPEALLVVVGDDAKASLVHAERMKDAIARTIEALDLGGHVLLRGSLKDEELLRLYFRADVFVLPCLEIPGDVEGFGIVFLEAALGGAPCVATRTGGIPEAVEDGVTGLLAPPGDFEEIGKLITRLFRDEDLCRNLASAGAERAKNHFSWDAIVLQYEKVLAGWVERVRESGFS